MDRLYPPRRVGGQYVQVGVGVRVGLVPWQAALADGMPYQPIDTALLPAAGAARHRGGAAALQRQFHHQWHDLHRQDRGLHALGRRRAIRLIAGDWHGRCVDAVFYNYYRRNTCEMWCR